MTGPATSGSRATYVDTSALVKLIRAEPESARLRAVLATREPLVTSRLAAIELGRVCVREGVGTRHARAVLAALTVVEITAPVAQRATDLPPPGLRTLDAIHLATALALGDDLDVLVTYDRRLAEAAAWHGIAIVEP